MTTIANLLITPVVSLNSRFKDRFASSALDTPPPPVDNTKQWDFGSYCWKVTVESKDKDSGKPDKMFIGYSQNMNIAGRTKGACDRLTLPAAALAPQPSELFAARLRRIHQSPMRARVLHGVRGGAAEEGGGGRVPAVPCEAAAGGGEAI